MRWRRDRAASAKRQSGQTVLKRPDLKNIERSRITYALGAAVIAAAVFAYTSVGPASSQTAAVRRTATAQYGVVQSTVSGSGTIEPSDELNLGFKTAGTVTNVYIAEGEHVRKGQLLAELDPKSAEVTLDQAKASLQSAQATLAQEEESEGETSAGATGAASPGAATGAAGGSAGSGGARAGGISATAVVRQSASSTTQAAGSGASSERTRQSAATREANLASARAAVKSDKLALESDEQAVQDTKLYAPESGTIISLSGEVGETVSATGTSKVSNSESGAATGSSAAGAGAGRGAAASSAGSAGSSSASSSSAFAVLGKLSPMQLVVALSESEIGKVEVGQTATVTIEALSGTKLAAQVIGVATLPSSSSSSGVVSYDVTFQLDQLEAGLKPGMSATAEVVVAQAEGVNVPSSAISAGSVTVIEDGKQVRRGVLTGLAGNSSTLIRSGLNAGEKVLLPLASTSTSTSSTSALSRLRSRFGGALGGGGLAGAGPPGG